MSICLAAYVSLVIGLCSSQGGDPEVRPDILIVLIDDLGCVDLSSEGHVRHRTPHADQLRRDSLRFTNAYCNGPNCAPSRAALMTGKFGSRTGVHTVGSSRRGKEVDRRVHPPGNRTTLRAEEVSLAEMMSAAGYQTGYVGKWHLSESPLDQGFAFNIGGGKAGHPKSYFPPYKNAQLPDGPEGEFLVDRLASETAKRITQLRSEPKGKNNETLARDPWCVVWAPYAVHTPIQAPKEAVEEIRARHPKITLRQARYMALVEAMDRGLGTVLASIDPERTVVMFMSDNGGLNGITDSDPWRGGKGMLYEGGIRTPLYVRGPEITPGDIEKPVLIFDIYPTVGELGNASLPNIDATSLMPALRGLPFTHGPLYWHFPAYLEGNDSESHDPTRPFRTTPCGATREGDWKLIEYFENGEIELFNLADDPGETSNRAMEEPLRTESMRSRLNSWQKQVGAQMPTAKPKNTAAPSQ